jgi:putative transposase
LQSEDGHISQKAAKKFFRKLLKGLQDVPRVVITDKLRSYGAAKREILPVVELSQSRYLNNRCENSHRPTRQRERRRQGFKSAGHAQRFLSAFSLIFQHFRPRRHLLSACVPQRDTQSVRELGRDDGHEADGLSARSVGIEPRMRLLLSSDKIDPDKLTMSCGGVHLSMAS